MTEAPQEEPGRRKASSRELELADEIVEAYGRFEELTDREVRELEEKIEELHRLNLQDMEWGADGELTDEFVVYEKESPVGKVMDVAVDESGRILVAGPATVHRELLNGEESDFVASYDAMGEAGDSLISANGRYVAYDSGNHIQLADTIESHSDGLAKVVSEIRSDDETELWAVSPNGDVLIELKDKLFVMRPGPGGELQKVQGFKIEGELDQVEFSPDGKTFACRIGRRVCLARVPEKASRRKLTPSFDESGFVGATEVRPFESGLMVCANDGIDVRGTEAVPASVSYEGLPFGAVEHADVSPKGDVALALGNQVAVVSGGRLKHGKMEPLGTYEVGSRIKNVKFDAEGDRLLVVDGSDKVRVLSRTLP